MLRRSAFLAVLVAFVTQVRGAEFIGKVVKVSDGDTITVLDAGNKQHKIRLEGIDAPESKQAFGQKAKQALSTKISGQTVTIVWEKPDKFGRKLGHVYLGKRWINQELVAEGWAWHYRWFSSDKRLADAEIEARRSNRGLWADKSSQAPWDYRAEQKAKALAKKLNAMPHVQRAEIRLTDAGASTTVIQICDWHMIGAEAFIADENNRRTEQSTAIKPSGCTSSTLRTSRRHRGCRRHCGRRGR